MVFNGKKFSLLQVIYQCTQWLRFAVYFFGDMNSGRSLHRCVRGSSRRPMIFLSNIGYNIVYGSAPLTPRLRHYLVLNDFVFCRIFQRMCDCFRYVHPSHIESGCEFIFLVSLWCGGNLDLAWQLRNMHAPFISDPWDKVGSFLSRRVEEINKSTLPKLGLHNTLV